MAYHWINNHKVDWKRGEVEIHNQLRSVEPRAMSVLRVLVDAKGGVVTQQQLLDDVWGDIVVAPNALQRCIAQLRKSFNDDAKLQSVIKTHPKLGYSLVATISDKAPPTYLISNWTSRLKTPFIVAFFLTGLMVSAWYFMTVDQSESTLSRITMITSDDKPQFSGVIANDTLFFIQGSEPYQQQLVARHLTANTVKVVLDKQWFYGGLSASNDSHTLLYSTVTLMDNKAKCSNVMALTVASITSEVLISCDVGFRFNGQFVSDEALLYLHQVNGGTTQLKIHHKDSSSENVVNHLLGDVLHFAVNPLNKDIAVITQQGQQFYLNVASLSKHALALKQRWEITNTLAKSSPSWRDDARVYMASSQSIEWFDRAGQRGELALPSKNSLYNVLHYDDRFVVELGRDDWDINQRSFDETGSNKILSRSIYAEYGGRYRPLHNEYSFISNRTGVAQLWLQEETQPRQVTSGQHDVQSYSWSADGTKVAVVTHGQLLIINLTGERKKIPLHKHIKEVYQWISAGGNSQQSLLLAIGQGDNEQLALVNLLNGAINVIADVPTQWAQRVTDNVYITNTRDGYLQSVTVKNDKATISRIAKTKALKLQWRFFMRDNHLYFQDKSKNVWQFDVLNNQLDIIGQYDEHSLLMTDIDPKQQIFLSDSLSRQIRDLAFVD